MRLQVMKAAGVGIALVALLGACGSSDKKSEAPQTTPTTAAPAETTTTAPPPNPHKATATPTTNLTNGQKVTVSVSGFTAGKTLGINECATTTDDTGSGCDLGNIQQIKVGADGTASGSINVSVGPFGADKVVCTDLKEPEYCLLSVGELAAGDVERSDDIKITFAP
jgi:Neocarzinostatin family